ncbi:MAG TPA: aspartate aminotransferase family protein [Blastocatellia bacterium]|nr:aspartate aminotransferase family protein [Blastocatellia bacterium]
MSTNPKSCEILKHNSKYIPGGVVSVNRKVEPEIVFVRADGAYMWDADGKRYIDYHAAFGPYFLGHNHPRVVEAVAKILHDGTSLPGTGTTVLEGQLAELLCENIEAIESVILLNTGSEATSQAIRLARAVTGRDHIIVTQGGYNGWYDDVARQVMTPLEEIGPRLSPGEYRFIPMGSGIPTSHQQTTHIINFNDLDSVRYVCERYRVAALITEPILQNIGIVKPQPGYLRGLRELADRYGFVLIFDEVKTGFRHAFGGYSKLSQVKPHLVTYGKAIANGYPLAVLGGERELMDYFVHPDKSRRPLLAGTYNAHPVPVSAAIATLELLLENDGEIYRQVDSLGANMQEGIESILQSLEVRGIVARQGSAFSVYFMDHAPQDWHDLAENHDFEADGKWRRALIDRGVYIFPEATKQCSISATHTEADIAFTLERMQETLQIITSDGASRLRISRSATRNIEKHPSQLNESSVSNTNL